ncbi:MAG: hypothetical protein PV340_01760 [Wolbachia sp.]|nr:hypothetical protein [Wolbachia sp.]MDD9336452.1 hypothetical protein [Wolbachia sp.]
MDNLTYALTSMAQSLKLDADNIHKSLLKFNSKQKDESQLNAPAEHNH